MVFFQKTAFGHPPPIAWARVPSPRCPWAQCSCPDREDLPGRFWTCSCGHRLRARVRLPRPRIFTGLCGWGGPPWRRFFIIRKLERGSGRGVAIAGGLALPIIYKRPAGHHLARRQALELYRLGYPKSLVHPLPDTHRDGSNVVKLQVGFANFPYESSSRVHRQPRWVEFTCEFKLECPLRPWEETQIPLPDGTRRIESGAHLWFDCPQRA
jgi:hypothetical protein